MHDQLAWGVFIDGYHFDLVVDSGERHICLKDLKGAILSMMSRPCHPGVTKDMEILDLVNRILASPLPKYLALKLRGSSQESAISEE